MSVSRTAASFSRIGASKSEAGGRGTGEPSSLRCQSCPAIAPTAPPPFVKTSLVHDVDRVVVLHGDDH